MLENLLLEVSPQGFCEIQAVLRADVIDEHGKLITADSANVGFRELGTARSSQQFGDISQQGIAGFRTIGGVDDTELVYIQDHKCGITLVRRRGCRADQP